MCKFCNKETTCMRLEKEDHVIWMCLECRKTWRISRWEDFQLRSAGAGEDDH